MRKNKLLQKIKDELDYYLDDYWDDNDDYICDKYDDSYEVPYEYLPKEKQTYKKYLLKNKKVVENLEYGMLIDMLSIYPKEKIRNLKLDFILKHI